MRRKFESQPDASDGRCAPDPTSLVVKAILTSQADAVPVTAVRMSSIGFNWKSILRFTFVDIKINKV